LVFALVAFASQSPIAVNRSVSKVVLHASRIDFRCLDRLF
jgi:hypothetical protein